MRLYYDATGIKGVCWDKDIPTLDKSKIALYSVITIDESVNSSLTIDIARWYDSGKYYVLNGQLIVVSNWTEPTMSLPIVNPQIYMMPTKGR